MSKDTTLSHFRYEKVPIHLFGYANNQGEDFYLYEDAQGQKQVLRLEQHDRWGIGALFAGAEEWLQRIGPSTKEDDDDWDDTAIKELLLYYQRQIGRVDANALGFELPR